MDALHLLSLLLNITGTVLAITGAIYCALKFYKLAYTIWVCSNFLLMILFVGVAMGYWVLDGAAWLQVAIYGCFCITSVIGYRTH